MPFIEYMLLAILGSSPATTQGTPSMRTLTADAIAQPGGGAEVNLDFNSGITLLGQDTGGCKGMASTGKGGTGKKPQKITWRRHRRHHNKVIKDTATRNAAHKG